MAKLTGKSALVTGAGRGIGRAIALALAREGAAVGVVDVDASALGETAGMIRATGAQDASRVADVSDEHAVAAAFAEIGAGLGRIDILVNNAGIVTNAQVRDMPIETWDRMIAVNLRSVFLGSRLVLPGMLERRWGRIINLSSQLAQKGGLTLAHYAAAKAGVIGFTRSLALEVARHGVTVNAICPGPIDTEMTRGIPADWQRAKLSELPIGRFGTVDEIAPTAVMLASDDGAYYCGATLNPNGGDVMV